MLKDAIKKIEHEKVVQLITDIASVMKSMGALIEGEYPKIFWTPCVVHTLNLALKNICAAKNIGKNEITYSTKLHTGFYHEPFNEVGNI